MPAYKDKRNGKVYWRYRKWIKLLDGTRTRIKGKGAANTKESAEQAEHDEIERLLHPEKALARAALARESTSLVNSDEPTIEELAKLVIDEYKPDGKPGATDSRTKILNGWIVPFFGKYRPSQLDQGHIELFVKTCLAREPKKKGKKRRGGNAAQTINNKLSALSVVLKYAVARKKIAAVPVLSLRRDNTGRESNPVKPYSRDEIKALIKAAASDQRYVVAILLGAEAGLRIGEIRGLYWSDIDFRGTGAINVRRAIDARDRVTGPNGKPLGTKNNGTRTLPFILPRLREALEALPRSGMTVLARLEDEVRELRGIAKRRARIKGDALGYQGMSNKMARIMRDAGIPKRAMGGDKSPWHSLRHSFATELDRRGVPESTIQRLLDHSDPRTTRRYITPDAQHDRDVVLAAFDMK